MLQLATELILYMFIAAVLIFAVCLFMDFITDGDFSRWIGRFLDKIPGPWFFD